MIGLVKRDSAFGLLWLELEKLARQTLKLFAGLLLILAVLNTSLGAAVILTHAPEPFSNSSLTEPSARLLHLQLFGGLVHLHEPNNGSDHSHSAKGHQAPPGVTEFLVSGDDFSSVGAYSLSGYSDTPGLGKTDYPSGWSQNAFYAMLSVLGLLTLGGLSGRLARYNQPPPDDPHLKRLDRPPIPF